MGYGGATWDTAGTLDLGSDNTFNTSDVDPDDGDGLDGGLNFHAWWTVTVGADARVTAQLAPGLGARVYTGDDYATRVWLDNDWAEDGVSPVWNADAGVTYHLLVGTYDDPPSSYGVARAERGYVYSPWFEDLLAAEDNFLIISSGTVIDQNPNPGYSTEFMPEWTAQVIRVGQGRTGDYSAQEVLGGAPVSGAVSCVVAHAENGDQGNQSWNNSTTGSSATFPPVCRPLGSGSAAGDVARAATSLSVSCSDSEVFASDFAEATIRGSSYGLWFLPVRDNLNPWGVIYGDALTPVDPTARGYPSDAEVIFEADHPDLLSIELGDGDPLAVGAAGGLGIDNANRWALEHPIAPLWLDGSGTWNLGTIEDPPSPSPDYLAFTYFDADDEQWHTKPDSAGWDGHGWTDGYTGLEPPTADAVVVAQPVDYNVPVSSDFDYATSRTAHIALKFNLRAQRFRFRWLAEDVIPPRQIWGRPGDEAMGAARVYGGAGTVQTGTVYGGIL